MTTNLTVKRHKVQLNGNLMTGDTYPIKSWIKTYLNGQWDAGRKGWIVDLGQVEMWTGMCIQIDNSAPSSTDSRRKLSSWVVNTKHGRELGEDY